MTVYNGTQITYDEIGNPLSDGTWNYTWQHGRQLAGMTSSSGIWNFSYNADGMRTQRTNGVHTYNYVYTGGNLVYMTAGTNALRIGYDLNGSPIGLQYNGVLYFYVTNLQGDVIAILNTSGDPVVNYTYDAWGNVLTATDSNLAKYNPLRYRGYVYDWETGLYYLQSRYYNPEWGRFINADGLLDTRNLVGLNLFAYCFNNPVNYSDNCGESPDTYAGWVGEQIGKLIYDWLVGNGFENATGTFSVGISGAVNGGPGGTASVGMAFDAKGNMAIVFSPGGGGGFPYIGWSGFASITNADDVYQLAGMSVATGGSANVFGYSIGGEYVVFKNAETGEGYDGRTFLMGGAAALPAEWHAEVTYTHIIWSANVRDWFNSIR